MRPAALAESCRAARLEGIALARSVYPPLFMTQDGGGWWRRVPTARGRFRYERTGGAPLRSASGLERIERMRIPPAWTDVHIAPDSKRKVQAWGYDQAGRKQYIYSEAHVQRRDRRKWERVLAVARLLPRLRRVTNRHLKRRHLDREKVMATVVRLMCRGFFRSGSERYAVSNRTFGICTLKKRHVSIHGNELVFRYHGKRQKSQRQVIADTPLVEIVDELLAQPGVRLFRYRDEEGRWRPVTAPGVNRYLREAVDERITSKDLRTFGGTLRAALILAELGPAATRREAARNAALTCRLVSHALGNTPAICRQAYIHPAVLERYVEEGRTIHNVPARRRANAVEVEEPVDYYPEELELIRFLERYGRT
jgi:DNA topoisomerase I